MQHLVTALFIVLSFGTFAKVPSPSQLYNSLYHDSDFEQLEDEKISFENSVSAFGVNGKKHKRTWLKGDLSQDYLDLNVLDFTNKASCGLDSKLPAKSVTLILDSLFAGKVAYRYALASNQDKNYITKEAISRFRYSVLSLVKVISSDLLSGTLPVLPSDSNSKHTPSRYREIMSKCQGRDYCVELDLYLKDIWELSRKTEKNNNFLKLDNFNLKHSFIGPGLSQQPSMSCYYLKQHSALLKHLDTTVPSLKDIALIAHAVKEQESFLGSCFDFSAQTDLEYSGYQIELLNLDDSEWNKVGYDFWHSLKLYISYAFRHKETISALSFPFSNLFRSVHLEDSLLLYPNGCRTMVKPTCTENYLADQILRDFTQDNFKASSNNYDQSKIVAAGIEDSDITNDNPEFNADILDFNTQDSMDKWIKNFQTNFQQTRGAVKTRLLSSINTFDILLDNLNVDRLYDSLVSQIESSDAWPIREDLPFDDLVKKNQLYYLCAEYLIGSDEIISFIRADLDKLKNLKSIDPIFDELSSHKVSEYYTYFDKFASKVRATCMLLEKQKIWENNFVLVNSGFFPWYQETIYKKSWQDVKPVAQKKYLTSIPLIANSQFAKSKSLNDVVCVNAIECSRLVLSSIINIYSATRYSQTYFGSAQKIKSADLLNPLSERVACGVYDPWWKTKKSYLELFMDLSQAAVSVVNPVPVYISATLPQKKVASFNSLIENEDLVLDPKYDGPKVLAAIGADFGPMLGVPCTLSISNDSTGNFNGQYYFSGITYQACVGVENSNIVVNSASETDPSDVVTVNGCISCNIGLTSTATPFELLTNVPYVAASIHLIRGVVRFVQNYRDPINIPKKFQVNVNATYETFRKYGEIPKRCLKPLTKGKWCLDNKFEHAASIFLQSNNLNAANYYFDGDDAFFSVSGCDESVKLSNVKTFFNLVPKKKFKNVTIDIPTSCISQRTIKNEYSI